MTVIYAEKPDFGRKIAAALSSKVNRQDGYLEFTYKGEPTIVTWGFGHMYGLQNAYDYDEKYKSWNIQLYPFFPDEYKIRAGEGVNKQLKVINKLLKSADLVVNATDAGREGELIFSYVMEGLRIPRKPIKRLWLHSTEPSDIRNSYDNMQDGKQMHSLEQAARARAIIDWSIGINLTIFATNAFRNYGQNTQPISVGRVQTPTLALVVNRELAIRNFVSKPFWNLDAEFTGKNGTYKARLEGDSLQTESEALSILKTIEGKNGTVEDVAIKREDIAPPELFNLSGLQKEASKRFKFTAQQTLDLVQKLYENGYLSYPRSSSTHLPENMKGTVKKTLDSLASHPLFSKYLTGITYEPFTRRHFDDKKVGEHYAIIPTGKIPTGTLSDAETNIYQLVAHSLIRVAYPSASFEKTTVITNVDGYKFKSSGKQLLDLGWMAVDAEPKKDSLIPRLTVGEKVSGEYIIAEGKTTPPSRYTDGLLIAAMEHIAKEVDDKDIKDRLKTIGIGTEATRAKTIEQLVLRGYVKREKSNIVPTELGIHIIEHFPVDALKSPVLTGELELMLSDIESGSKTQDDVILTSKQLVSQWCDLIRPYCLSPKNDLPGPGKTVAQPEVPCPICGRPLNMRMDAFVGCTGYRDAANPCKFSISRTVCGKKLTPTQITNLLSGKSIKVKGMKSKAGKDFDATLSLDPSGKITFTFENKVPS